MGGVSAGVRVGLPRDRRLVENKDSFRVIRLAKLGWASQRRQALGGAGHAVAPACASRGEGTSLQTVSHAVWGRWLVAQGGMADIGGCVWVDAAGAPLERRASEQLAGVQIKLVVRLISLSDATPRLGGRSRRRPQRPERARDAKGALLGPKPACLQVHEGG